MIVLKIGGSEGINYDLIADDIAALVKEGQPLIVIHGGSSLTNKVAEQLGHPPQFVTSVSGFTSRRTDRRTLEIFEMVYCGQMNKGLVEKLQQRGVNAVGLSGIDGRIWEGTRKSAIKIIQNGRKRVLRDDFTGKVERVNAALAANPAGCRYAAGPHPAGHQLRRRSHQCRRRPGRRGHRRRLSSRSADHSQQRAGAAGKFPGRVEPDPPHPRRQHRPIYERGRRPHEKESDGRTRSSGRRHRAHCFCRWPG